MDSRSRGLGFESRAPTSEHGNVMVSGSHQDGLSGEEREGGAREEEKERTREEGDRKGEGKSRIRKRENGKKPTGVGRRE